MGSTEGGGSANRLPYSLICNFLLTSYSAYSGAIMSKIKLALIGCGGMGTRHLYGMQELLALYVAPSEEEVSMLCTVSNPRDPKNALSSIESRSG